MVVDNVCLSLGVYGAGRNHLAGVLHVSQNGWQKQYGFVLMNLRLLSVDRDNEWIEVKINTPYPGSE